MRVLPRACAHCGKMQDGASHVDYTGKARPIVPKPGDVGVCIDCGGVFIFEAASTRKPNPEEQAHIEGDDLLRRVTTTWAAWKASQN